MLVEHLLSSSGAGPPLRVAAILDDGSLGRPEAQVLDHVLRSGFAQLVLLVHETRRPSARQATLLRRLASPESRSRLLFDAYERWDRARESALGEGAGDTDLARRLARIPALRIDSVAAGNIIRYPGDAPARIRAHAIDVAIRLGRDRLQDIDGIARYGVWSLRLGDEGCYRGGPPHFWELAERNPVSAVSLEVHRGAGAPLVLCKGIAATSCERWGFSIARSGVSPRLLGATFVIRKLKQLHEHGFAAIERDALARPPYRGKRHSYRAPTNLEVAAFLAPRLAGKAWLRLAERPRVVHWRIGVRLNGSPAFESTGPLPLDGFRWIEAPSGRLYADPMLFEHRGQLYCFFEDFDHCRRVGRISCAAIDSDGRFLDVRPALERPYHLSYPYVLADAGEVFMIPESRRNATVDLYRAVRFPDRWEKVRTLLEGPGLDTTVLRTCGRFWFFVAVREPEGAGEQLLLFHSESLTSELRFHPRNPVSTDVRSCRPAGTIFSHRGSLVRPAQDCSVTYGHQLAFRRIVTLNEDDFREEALGTIAPPRGYEGIHTYNRHGRVEVVDVKRLEPASRHLTGGAAR